MSEKNNQQHQQRQQRQRMPFNPASVDTTVAPVQNEIVIDNPVALVPAQIAQEKKSEWMDVVATEYLSVRSAPSVTAEVLIILTRGRTYQVELSGKPWLKIVHPKLGERIGYVSATILNGQPVRK